MTFEEEFEAAPLKRVFITARGVSKSRNAGYDPGRAIEGAYKVAGGQVILCDAHGGEVIGGDGRKYRHTLKTGSGEMSAHEAAVWLTRKAKSGLKIGGSDRKSGFEYGPLPYRRLGWL
jgi:hypothetical protein